MRTAAILPVKRFAEAKQRLRVSIADPLRAELARAMVADVLSALARTGSIERTIVVTREERVAAAARRQGALALGDDAEAGQSTAVSAGVRRALAEGFERVLCIPGDCPALDPDELDALLDAPATADTGFLSGDPEVVIVPDRHGSGTNGLLLTPPDAIEPSFGPGSCDRHRALAAAAGAVCRLERPPSLLLDVDTGADLQALRDRLAAAGASARRTRAVLGGREHAEVASATSAG